MQNHGGVQIKRNAPQKRVIIRGGTAGAHGQQSPFRRFKNLGGLGDTSAQALMSTTFKKPFKAAIGRQPIIDGFSRTLGAPVTSDKDHLSVVHRIGANFTPTSKGLYIDSDARAIRFKKLDRDRDGKVEDRVLNQSRDQLEQNRPNTVSQASRDAHARHRQRLENDIPIDSIAPIRQHWLTHIIELMPGDLHAVERQRIEQLIDSMLENINVDYINSQKRSILDYVIKNAADVKRLGLQEELLDGEQQPVNWGDDFYRGVEPSVEQKQMALMARMVLSENLPNCSHATLQLMELWRDFQNLLLVNLPQKREEPSEVREFIDAQYAQMEGVRTLLSNDWNKAAVNILREELENLDKDQTKRFFESSAVLMANQARQLVEQSLDKYVDFIQQYEMQCYPTPKEIIEREYDATSPYEHNFIALKLDVDEDLKKFKFDVPLAEVQNMLVSIVDQMITQSNNLPRADNSFQRNDNQHLWAIAANDEKVLKAKQTISSTIGENLIVVEQALELYKEFEFILNEKERLEDYLQSKKFDRDVAQSKINKYQDTIARIRATMPFEVRMNMFLIECKGLNNALCKMCEDLINDLLEAINNHVLECASRLTSEVKQIKDDLLKRAENSRMLVEFEERVDKVKLEDKARLKDEYQDMIEWLMMLFQNRRYQPDDRNMRPILTTFEQINAIDDVIEEKERALEKDRRELEERLLAQRRDFTLDLEQVKTDVKAFASHDDTRRAPRFRAEIGEIEGRIKHLNEVRNGINQQEADLNMMPSEFAILDQVAKDLALHRELWDLQVEFRQKMEQWSSEALKNLVQDQVEASHERMMSLSQQLAKTMEQKRNPSMARPMQVAKRMYKELSEFKVYVELICALKSTYLYSGHIAEIVTLMNLAKDRSNLAEITVHDLKLFEVVNVKDQILEICNRAKADFMILSSVAQMKEDLKTFCFKCEQVEGREPVVYVLNVEVLDLIQADLEEFIEKTQTMKAATSGQALITKLNEWEQSLVEVRELLNDWMQAQQIWQNLEPVFSSQDIGNQLPEESKIFQEFNATWCDMMSAVADSPPVMEVNKIPKAHATIKKVKGNLKKVEKGLYQHVSSICGSKISPEFERLSSDELLQILAENGGGRGAVGGDLQPDDGKDGSEDAESSSLTNGEEQEGKPVSKPNSVGSAYEDQQMLE